MKITEQKIQDVLGLKRQKDLFERAYYDLVGIGHFYLHDAGGWYFRADEEEEMMNGIYAQNIITDWKTIEKLYL